MKGKKYTGKWIIDIADLGRRLLPWNYFTVWNIGESCIACVSTRMNAKVVCYGIQKLYCQNSYLAKFLC